MVRSLARCPRLWRGRDLSLRVRGTPYGLFHSLPATLDRYWCSSVAPQMYSGWPKLCAFHQGCQASGRIPVAGRRSAYERQSSGPACRALPPRLAPLQSPPSRRRLPEEMSRQVERPGINAERSRTGAGSTIRGPSSPSRVRTRESRSGKTNSSSKPSSRVSAWFFATTDRAAFIPSTVLRCKRHSSPSV